MRKLYDIIAPARTRPRAPRRASCSSARARDFSRALRLLAALLLLCHLAAGQGEPRHTLYGDFKVDESGAAGGVPKVFNVILQGRLGNTVGRQQVSNNGRFTFPSILN